MLQKKYNFNGAWFTGARQFAGSAVVHQVHQITGGALVHWFNGAPVYSWCTGVPVHWFTGKPVHWFTGAPVYGWCTGAPVHWFTGAPVHRSLVHQFTDGALVHRFTGTLVHQFTGGALVHRFTGSLVHRFTGSLVDQFTGGALVHWCTGSLVLHCIAHWCIWFTRQRIASRRDCMATFGDGMQQQSFPGLHPGMGTSPASMHHFYIHGVGNYY